jgi:hypothetical protein
LRVIQFVDFKSEMPKQVEQPLLAASVSEEQFPFLPKPILEVALHGVEHSLDTDKASLVVLLPQNTIELYLKARVHRTNASAMAQVVAAGNLVEIGHRPRPRRPSACSAFLNLC